MTASPFRLVHVAPWITTGGGIETVLRWHLLEDVAHGLESYQLALFDRGEVGRNAGRDSLRFGWQDTLSQMRRRFAAAMAVHANAMVIYHNAWGLPLFADLDQARRRVAYLHAGPRHVTPMLPALPHWLDGVATINPTLSDALRQFDPAIDDERIAILETPVQNPVVLAEVATRPKMWTIGYAGRLERADKRADLLPVLVRHLDALGCSVQVEILGDGKLRRGLERQLRGRAIFHGWKSGEEYWEILSRWHAIVFFSESEGGPLAMVEGMAAGALPLYPRIGGSLGDIYAPRIDPRCYYPAADIAELARRICELTQESDAVIAASRKQAQQLARAHEPRPFGDKFAKWVRHVAALPRVSRAAAPSRQTRAMDHLPLGVITRLFPKALWR